MTFHPQPEPGDGSGQGRCGRRASQANGTQRRAYEIERDLVCAKAHVGPVLEVNEGEAQGGRGSRQDSDPF